MQRNATQRKQRNATQRNATQRNTIQFNTLTGQYEMTSVHIYIRLTDRSRRRVS